jgi:tellurite methyltransferase
MSFQDRFDQKYRANPHLFGQKPMLVLKKSLKYVSSGRALELGVGNGRNATYLLSKGFTVTGIDNSQEGIKILKKKFSQEPRLQLIKANVLNFSTKEKFDLVCAIGLLHFFELKNIKKLVNKIKTNTQNGGVNVLAVKMTQNFANDLPHIFTHNELKKFYTKPCWEIKYYQEIERGRAKIAALISQKITHIGSV